MPSHGAGDPAVWLSQRNHSPIVAPPLPHRSVAELDPSRSPTSLSPPGNGIRERAIQTTGPLKAKIQLATESDYQHLLSNLASNSQQLQRVFTQQDFVIDGRNHELWNAGLTVIIRYSKEEVLAGSPRSDSDRQGEHFHGPFCCSQNTHGFSFAWYKGCSIVLKETIFFGVDSGKPYFEVREKEERANLDNGEIKQILLGANVSAQSQSSILRDVISKYPVEGGIRCIGSFKNFRHVFVWDNVLIEIDRCSFPHGEGFFCRFDVDEPIIIKVLNYLQSTGITYCINITSKTALFFQGLNELAVTSQTNVSNNWLPLKGVMGGSSPGSIMTDQSPPAPLEPRTPAGMSAVNTNSIWSTAPFTVGGLPAADITLPGIVTKPPTSSSSVNAILIGNTPPLPAPISVSTAGIPPPMTLPSVASQISQAQSQTSLNQVSPAASSLSASPSLDGFKPSSSIIVLDQTDTAEQSSGGGPLRTNGGLQSGSKLGGGTKVNGAAPKGGSMSDGGAPEEEESAEMQKRRNRVEYEELSVKVSEHEQTIQLLRERVRRLEGENAALKLRIGVAPAASLK
ncbi:hypothetical protein M427DRAFT_72784 [Gonapodya prolifera JEL478]|uniref:Uncharacterized protein n=1 Tax=Gonapodya prolifera (strain JEL478) TaxID=1344416 RepID=A0A139A3X9_GONPJ|nr:hypothetical protein M427DRAFT_72784 [Gonapodya prolifera JEL478]|eukprot:KXS11512.1 hypothetical protein M427DRAFT_72784 [Gonapodya prolifera JEL478]